MSASSGGQDSRGTKRELTQSEISQAKRSATNTPPFLGGGTPRVSRTQPYTRSFVSGSNKNVHNVQSDGKIVPRHPKSGTKNAASNSDSKKSDPIATNNQYDVLKDDDTGDDDCMSHVSIPLTGKSAPKLKTAPIVIMGSSATAVQLMMTSSITSGKFECRLMRSGIRVSVPDPVDHAAATAALKAGNFQYYMYHTTATRPLKVVLYGLDDCTAEEARDMLKEINIVPDDVKKMVVRRQPVQQQGMFLLYFKPGLMKISKLREIKTIGYLRVRWEKYHPRQQDKVAQCHNCQRMGHSSVNCAMPARCLLCAEEHTLSDCPRRIAKEQLNATGQPADRSYIKCANCQKQHTANYLGCESRKSFIELQQKFSKKKARASREYNGNLASDVEFPFLGEGSSSQFHHHTQQESSSWAQAAGAYQQTGNGSSMINTIQALMKSMHDMMLQMSNMLGLMMQQFSGSR